MIILFICVAYSLQGRGLLKSAMFVSKMYHICNSPIVQMNDCPDAKVSEKNYL